MTLSEHPDFQVLREAAKRTALKARGNMTMDGLGDATAPAGTDEYVPEGWHVGKDHEPMSELDRFIKCVKESSRGRLQELRALAREVRRARRRYKAKYFVAGAAVAAFLAVCAWLLMLVL